MADALIVQQPSAAQHLVLLFHGVGASPQGLLPLAAEIARADPRAWVVSVPRLASALASWQSLGLDRGPALTASRPTPTGLLRWQISVRDDGQRLFQGCLPTLIEWGPVHPAQSMPDSGLRLQRLSLQHPEAPTLNAALAAIGLVGVKPVPGPARLSAELQTPRGPITLNSFT